MLNRLMFVYFIQKKGFLDNDHDYLRHKLVESQNTARDGFYISLLCPLFFEGLQRRKMNAPLKSVIFSEKSPTSMAEFF